MKMFLKLFSKDVIQHSYSYYAKGVCRLSNIFLHKSYSNDIILWIKDHTYIVYGML